MIYGALIVCKDLLCYGVSLVVRSTVGHYNWYVIVWRGPQFLGYQSGTLDTGHVVRVDIDNFWLLFVELSVSHVELFQSVHENLLSMLGTTLWSSHNVVTADVLAECLGHRHLGRV